MTPTTKAQSETDHATGVSLEAWAKVGAQRNGQAWRIPERDADGRLVGWLTRSDDGRKIADKDSTRGLSMAWPLPSYAGTTPGDPILVVEGASDAAAGIDLGFVSIGRPSATGGREHLRQMLRDRHVVIVGENDSGAGRSGAEKLAADLHKVVASVKLILPPECAKDLRDWYTAPSGCSREDLLGAIRAAEEYKPREVFNLTELGNAGRLVARHGRDLLYCDSWGKWFVWDGQRWAADNTREVHRQAEETVRSIYAEAQAETMDRDRRKKLADWAMKSESKHHAGAMVDLARQKLPVRPNQLDVDPWQLNVNNGTLNLRTGELWDHRPEDFITKLAPVEYHADAKCPQWLEFLNRIMAGDESLIGYLQRLLGMCLTGDVSVQEMFIFWGVGANGKSTLLDTIIALMGDYACIAPPNLLTARGRDEHPTEVADLFGKRLVVASETDEGRRLRTSLVKQVTGDLYLKGRFMRKDFFRFRRTHKTVLVTNNKPVVRESTKAMWRRLRLVPFNVVIPEAEQELGLVDELRAEWPGIMWWMVQGCLSWKRDGLGTPEAVTAATEEYRSEQDQLQQFVDESCQIGADLFVTRGDLWRAFQDWAQRVGENRPLGRNHIYEQLRAAGHANGWVTVAGKRTRVFRGIGLRHNDGAQQCTERNSDSPFTPHEADS